jgi:hypothetical protein
VGGWMFNGLEGKSAILLIRDYQNKKERIQSKLKGITFKSYISSTPNVMIITP